MQPLQKIFSGRVHHFSLNLVRYMQQENGSTAGRCIPMKKRRTQRDTGQNADPKVSLAKAWHLIGSGLDVLGKYEDAVKAYLLELEIEMELMPGKWRAVFQGDCGLLGGHARQ